MSHSPPHLLHAMRIRILLLALISWPFVCQAEDYDAVLKKAAAYGSFTFGMHEVSVKESAEALAAFQIATDMDPMLGRASFHLGNLLFDKQNFTKAKNAYLTALKIEPDYFYAYYNLACLESLRNQKEPALVYLESALRLGYNRFDKIPADTDFLSLKNDPDFLKLIEKYRALAKPAEGSANFLLATDDEQLEIIQKLFHTKVADWRAIADKALLDDSHRVRLHGLALYFNFEADERIPVLIRSLFDSNGYVNKAAANGLVQIGPSCLPYIDALMASEYKEAKFYGAQIKNLIGKATEKKAPLK